MPQSPAAVLFDIDGTLVDSNYLHADAWHRAFTELGLTVPTWRIHRAIGMDGSTLIRDVCPGIDDDTADRVDELHSRFYKDDADQLRLLPGAREILAQLHDAGLRVVLATSAPADELAILRRLLGSESVLYAVTSGEDVDTAKPDPTIVQIALERAGTDAGSAVFVGDSVWDMRACRSLRLPAVGVLSGGISRDELTQAGAAYCCDDVETLRRSLDRSPLAELLP